MDSFTHADLKTLVADQASPCVSIYTQTHRGGSEADTILWKHQLDEAEDRLVKMGTDPDAAARMLKPAQALLKKPEFLGSFSDGLALFATPNFFHTYRLPLAFKDQVVVGSRFQVTPILAWFADEARYFVLALSQNHVRLFEGNAHSLHQVATAPNKEEALKTHDRDEILNLHSQHGAAGNAMQAVFHGHGVGIDDHKDELLKYFQTVDHAIRKYMGDGQAPLVLATVNYLAPLYRKANKYPHLLEEIVHGNADHLTPAELHDKAMPLVAPQLHKRESKAVARFRQLAGTGQTTTDVACLLPAAAQGELESLFLVPGNVVWGEFNPTLNRVEIHASREGGDEDLLNLAAIHMIRRGRKVYAVSAERAFDRSPVAGIYFKAMAHCAG